MTKASVDRHPLDSTSQWKALRSDLTDYRTGEQHFGMCMEHFAKVAAAVKHFLST